jgi:hypothetical protein
MKLIVYTLNTDGTIPNYVIDGGYIPWGNGSTSPQDWDLVGVATDDAEQTGFVNEAALLAYVVSKGFEFKNPITEEVMAPETVVSSIWNKLG